MTNQQQKVTSQQKEVTSQQKKVTSQQESDKSAKEGDKSAKEGCSQQFHVAVAGSRCGADVTHSIPYSLGCGARCDIGCGLLLSSSIRSIVAKMVYEN